MSAKVCFLFVILAVIHVQAMFNRFMAEKMDVPVSVKGGRSLGPAKVKKDTNVQEIWNLVADNYNPSKKDLYIHLSDVIVNSKEIKEKIITFKWGSNDKIEITPETTMAIDYVGGP
ncbi:hypothetical protein DdX_14894 [Ditylenchus destructor]|uniref:Uncharacterized protein n=1 Tax=Ditylenchus destructor TaxID=166010 RepID=A0AAD4MW92_9BILA|nr:hypothetical protein DdX_14894 [Ditylenchus destructor]